ncbi:hypothetical protein GCM10020367_64370 [Streptomyces sannanensis]|uniref:Lipoprotein n=1 Tax=Streptomyces sannanensis TaxID=285536 RepID=A0ABP6S4F1_9ACTN
MAASAVLATIVAFGAGGCGGGEGAPSKTPSAVASVAESAKSVISSAASRASEAIASATASAQQKFNEIKQGVNAKNEVKLGAPTTDSEGRTTTQVSAKNTADSTKSFLVQVNFLNPAHELQDLSVVTIENVAAGKTGTATARSTHKLSGTITVEVGRALRH